MKRLVRSAMIALMACASAITCAAQSQPQIYRITSGSDLLQINALSDNGTYAISVTAGATDVDNPQPAGGTFINLTSGETMQIPAPSGVAAVSDVADNGVVVGSESGKPGYWSPETKEWKTFSLNRFDPLYQAGWTLGCFMSVTPDASVAVGYFMNKDNVFEVMPMAYDLTTGKRLELSGLPTVDLEGENKNQNIFYGVSPDGRYALGQMSQSYLMPVALFSYVYDLQENTWTPIGYNYNPTSQKFACTYPYLYYIDGQRFSCDGKWVVGTAYMVEGEGDMGGGSEYWTPYRYNVADNKLEVYDDLASQNLGGNQITAEGDVLACGPHGSSYPTAYVRSGNYFISLDQILRQVYGMDLEQYNGDGISGSFQALSADGLTAVMVTYDNCYVIRMPESFAAAASKVDLLANYSVNIPDGTTMGKISEIKITFDHAINCKNMPATVKITGTDGSSYSANATQVSPDNNHQLVVTFRTRTLQAGVDYSVEIPAEYISMANDSSIKSKAITLTYHGRGTAAVKPVEITPADGSLIAEFNSGYDVITITYDAEVEVSTTAQVRLYVDGDSNPIATLYCATSGNKAIFFPASTIYLYEGSEYRVVISKGTVTDLSGGGANDAMVLSYKGVYRRQLSDSDIYLLNENCDTYNTFMFYDGAAGQNAPGSIAQEWGFSDSNNAWILTTDDLESTDMALTTHSMFADSGTANAWLVTPQLYIPDERVYLAFDAQNYMRSKQDVIKVIVYEDNVVYNYMNEDLEQAMTDNGEVIIEAVLTPGENEELLRDEWQHFNHSLAKYAGKNIYIAFVNQNTDQSAIFIDNIQVVRDLNFVLDNQTPQSVVNRDEIVVKGSVTIASEVASFDGLAVALLDADGNLLDMIKDESVKLGYKDAFDFQFAKPLQLKAGVENRYVIEVTSGDVKSTYNCSVKNLMFEPMKKVVLEEFTGSECGNCPLGINAIERLEKVFPYNFIPITIRGYSGDYYGTGLEGYASALSLSAAPTGRVNRGAITMPAYYNGSTYVYEANGATDKNGDPIVLWGDEVRAQLDKAAEASISLSVSYDASTGELTVPCNVRFALDVEEKPVRIFGVVLEDNIFTYQVNYFNQESDPNLGEWAKGGLHGDATVYNYTFNDVGRFVITDNNFNGELMAETSFEAGKGYGHTLKANLPSSRLDDATGNSSKVVVILVDGSTNEIINANVARFGQSGIGDIVSDSDPSIAFEADGAVVTVSASSQVSLTAFAADGRRIGSAIGNGTATVDLGGYRGVVIVKGATAEGSAVGKLVIR